MRNYELTRVWEIDDKLFVANTIEDAIALKLWYIWKMADGVA